MKLLVEVLSGLDRFIIPYFSFLSKGGIPGVHIMTAFSHTREKPPLSELIVKMHRHSFGPKKQQWG
jgi:hypothetical protein